MIESQSKILPFNIRVLKDVMNLSTIPTRIRDKIYAAYSSDYVSYSSITRTLDASDASIAVDEPLNSSKVIYFWQFTNVDRCQDQWVNHEQNQLDSWMRCMIMCCIGEEKAH